MDGIVTHTSDGFVPGIPIRLQWLKPMLLSEVLRDAWQESLALVCQALFDTQSVEISGIGSKEISWQHTHTRARVQRGWMKNSEYRPCYPLAEFPRSCRIALIQLYAPHSVQCHA